MLTSAAHEPVSAGLLHDPEGDPFRSVMDRSMHSQHRWSIWVALLLAASLLVLTIVGLVAAYEFRYSSRIYRGVSVAGIPLDGLTREEAIEAVRDGLTPYPGATIALRYGARTWSLSSTDFGVAVDAPETVAAAFEIGRQGLTASFAGSFASLWQGLRTDLASQWAALRDGAAVTPSVRFDENRLALTLKRIAQEVDLPPREGALLISGLEVSGTPGQAGRLVNVPATRNALLDLIRAGVSGAVDLVVDERQPAVLAVDAAVAKASALLGRSFTLAAEGVDGVRSFAIDPVLLSQWLELAPRPTAEGAVDLSVQLDDAQVTAFVRNLAGQIDRPVFDARLDFDRKASQVVVLQPSQVGQTLDVVSSIAAVEAAIMAPAAPTQGQAASGAIRASELITLPVTIVPPRVDSAKVAEMGIVELVSEGTTYFAGSTRERVQNIAVAANKLRGAVVPPGEEFSFYHFVGDVTAANGFVDSLIIRGDRTETGVGGGVCQVSTTMFRAAFAGGFPILERYAHGYVVGWYGQPGLDAAIFTPDADFRFRNDTAHYLLVQPEVDAAKGRITFRLYGTSPGRTVTIGAPAISNTSAAPPPLYQEDATLAKGVIKQVDWPKDGMDVVVKRAITNADGSVKEDRVASRYRPWRAVYLYGPGTELPPEAGGE